LKRSLKEVGDASSNLKGSDVSLTFDDFNKKTSCCWDSRSYWDGNFGAKI